MHQIYLLLSLLFGGLSTNLLAQDYPTGFARYLQSEFATAEGIFQNLLASGEMPKKERAQTLKVLGLAQYMQGKRNEAADSFKLAKKLSPLIRIQKNEILDETVLDFFNSIEAPAPSIEEEVVPKKKTRKAVAPEPVEQKAEPVPTNILIISNVIEGRIIIDGFFRGRVGDTIPIDPGTHSVEVYANGYQNEVQTLQIEASHLNKFTFKLEKLPETQKPEVKVEAPPVKKEEPKEEKKVVVHKKKKKHKPLPKPPEEMAEGLYFIPFGVPQFIQGKPWTGLGFSLLQVVGFGFTVARTLEANQVTSDTNSTVDSRNAQEAQIADPAQRKAFASATDDYYSSQLSQIDELRTQAYLSLGFFALCWVASGAEAYYNPPTPPAPARTSQELRRQEKSWSWSLSPTFAPSKASIIKGSYGLNLAIRF